MSFVKKDQQANAADANRNASLTASSSQSTPALVAESSSPDVDLQFKQRTFDAVWVEKKALMYREGISKVRLKFEYY
jgi:hypothetical protein